MQSLLRLFSEEGLPPHGFCLLWDPTLIWLHAASDIVIGASYYSIPLALAYFVWQRRDLAFGWMFRMFGAFILLCGTTHFFEVWVLWNPDYGAQGLIKAATAATSLATAVALWPLLPRALALPSPAELRRANDALEIQVRERNEALRAVHETEQRYRLLVDGVVDCAIFMLDPRGIVTNWNAGAERMKGYRADEIVGRHVSLFYTPEDRAAGAPEAALTTAAHRGKYEAEALRVRKDGSRFWANVMIGALHDENGRLVGFAKITRDVTERRQAQEAMTIAQERLAQAQKMEAVGQLTGGVAHDFNNLLTTILGNLDLLQRHASSGDARDRELLASVRRAAEAGAALTARLLAFARRQALSPQNVDLNRLVAGMSELLRRTLGESIAVESVLAGGLWLTPIDPNQLESAILNLAINARDAMPGGGQLTIETGNTYLDDDYVRMHAEVTPGQYVLLAVSDTGTGMSEEILERAFEPFYTTKDPGEGTGLGLSQVYGFVKQSGGHINIYSELGSGTTVKLYLPRQLAAVEDEPPAPLPIERGSSELILVVEDDPDVRRFSTDALSELGYRVIEAKDAAAALRQMDLHPEIALLFTDVGLPGSNGRQLAEEARRRRPGLRLLYTTGYARNAVVHHGRLDAGVQLLNKPFTVEALAIKVRQILGKPG